MPDKTLREVWIYSTRAAEVDPGVGYLRVDSRADLIQWLEGLKYEPFLRHKIALAGQKKWADKPTVFLAPQFLESFNRS